MQKRCKLHSGRVYVASLRPLAAGHALFWRQKLRLVGFFFSEAKLSIFLSFAMKIF